MSEPMYPRSEPAGVMSEVLAGRDELLTVRQVAKALNVRERWVYDAIAQRRIPHTKLGHLVRFSRVELAEWINSQQVAPRE